MRIPTQVSAVNGVRKSKKPDPSEMSFLSRMLIPVCMNGLVIPTAFSRAAVRVSGAIARSASCREWHVEEDVYIYITVQLLQSRLLPFDSFKCQFSCTHPSHHLSNHPVPVPVVILPAVRAIFHQLHSVLEAHFLGYFREQVHAKTLQLCALGNCVRLLL